MIIRDYRKEDNAQVRSLHERSCTFPFPNLEHPLYLAKTIVEEDNNIVGFGCLKVTSEAIIILGMDGPKRVRGQALDELLRTGVFKCQKLGFKDMHAFLTGQDSESFKRTLVKRFGFSEHSGEVLVLEV